MEGCRIFRGKESVAHLTVAEHLRKLREDLKMPFGGLFRHEEGEYKGYGFGIGCVKRDRRCKPDHCPQRFLQAFHPAMRDCDPMSKTGRTETLANKKAVEDDTARNALIVLEKQTEMLEQALFARNGNIDFDVRRWKKIGDEVHRVLSRGWGVPQGGRCEAADYSPTASGGGRAASPRGLPEGADAE